MRVKLLYVHHDVRVTTPDPPHIHPFWQIEICVKGFIHAESNIGKINIKAGDFIIIPPQTVHAFSLKGAVDFESFTLKFSIQENKDDLLPVHIAKNFFTERIISTVYELIKDKTPASLNRMNEYERDLIEYLTWVLLDYCYSADQNKIPAVPELARRLKEEISYENKNLNVANAAEKLGCTPGHLNYLCKKELGIPAKKFIDNEIFRIAAEHLKYSSLNISEISKLMSFPDVYTFSKFFKKFSRLTPSEFRRG